MSILRVDTIQNSAGTSALSIDTIGRVTAPATPMFAAKGASANYTLVNGGEVPFSNAFFNIGSHFNTSNYRFTCPVTGTYIFTVSLFTNGGTGRISFKVNNTAYQNLQANWGDITSHWSQSVIWRLNANDFVSVGDWQDVSGAVIYMGHSQFCGYLLG